MRSSIVGMLCEGDLEQTVRTFVRDLCERPLETGRSALREGCIVAYSVSIRRCLVRLCIANVLLFENSFSTGSIGIEPRKVIVDSTTTPRPA